MHLDHPPFSRRAATGTPVRVRPAAYTIAARGAALNDEVSPLLRAARIKHLVLTGGERARGKCWPATGARIPRTACELARHRTGHLRQMP